MSAPFVTQLRSGRPPIKLAEPGKGVITIRVEASALWDSVRVIAPSTATVADIMQRAVDAFYPGQGMEAAHVQADFVLKFRGWEMLDLNSSLAASGVVDGSILLLAHRHRRPIR